MFTKIKSLLTMAGLFLQYNSDNIYRVVFGMPRLRRCQITADLFLGSQYNLVGLRKMKALGITAIINMRMHSVYSEAQYEGFNYLHLPTPDNTPPPLEVLQKGADFADKEIKKNGKVYIHCRQGLGRGPTMCTAYLLKTGLTLEDALAMIRKVRPFINPRPGQLERLKELEAIYKNAKS
ncbi:dual specificity protein phosphatase family protein [Mucilaginibacter sp. SMC90]|uniref:protein-tyrosine phosphatase family protein n=1 Tax=Mucilaginibacter sp. SMC90 TaxID=2929803 RepID=UPI001FB28B88|nr:dual specificity protein phosphatase [Mucilaginibacter sp. SMC90]UOE52499.1 dual specificity protein phosphatase family protein [Mucilaginibacter sp. SMC90]